MRNVTAAVQEALGIDPSIRASRHSGLGPNVLVVGRSLADQAKARHAVLDALPTAWVEHVWIERNLTRIHETKLPGDLAPLVVQRSYLTLWPVQHDTQLKLGYDLIVCTDVLEQEERKHLLALVREGRPSATLCEVAEKPLAVLDRRLYWVMVTTFSVLMLIVAWVVLR